MNDHDLGLALRAYLLRERQHNRPLDSRRLQAVLGDLIASDQDVLLPALRALVLSNAFSSAIGQEPPLADRRLLPRLRQELAPTFSLDVRQRMDDVLAGLLDQVAPGTGSSPAMAPATNQAAPAPTPPATSDRPGGGWAPGLLVLTAVLAILGGIAMAIVGGGVMLWLRHRSPQPETAPPAAITPPIQAPITPSAPLITPGSTSTTAPAPSEGGANASEAALQSLGNLYQALSSKNGETAKAYYADSSSDQFDPAFFRQFASVSLGDLRETGRSGSLLFFSGVVTFAYPDGTRQLESRTFTVDTSRSPAVVTASAFDRMIQLRR